MGRRRHWAGITVFFLLLGVIPSVGGAQTMIVWWNPDGWEVYPALAERFMELHPGIQVEVRAISEDEFLDKFQLTRASGTDIPDVITWYFPVNIARHRWFEDLTPYFERDGLVPEDEWFPISIARTRYQNRYYSVPRDVSPGGMGYNMDIFDRFGLAYPGDDYDIQMFEADMRKVHQPNSEILTVDGETLGPGGLMWTFLAAGLDVQLVSEDGTQVMGYLDSQRTLHAFEWWAGLTKEGLVKQEGTTEEWFFGGNAAFGSVAMWGVDAARDADFRWGLHPGAKQKDLPRKVYADSVLYYMTSESKHKEEAWKLLKFLSTSSEAGEVISSYLDYAPPMRRAWIENDLINDPALSKFLPIAQLPADVPNYLRTEYMWDIVSPAIWEAWEKDVVEGTGSIVNELREATKSIQAQLDEKYAR